MNDFLALAPAFAAGLLLGAIFFGGLWWTVRKGVSSERPALWFFGSMVLRMGMTLLGFYLIGGESWERWLLCLIGFFAARLVVTRLTRPSAGHEAPDARADSYAP